MGHQYSNRRRILSNLHLLAIVSCLILSVIAGTVYSCRASAATAATASQVPDDSFIYLYVDGEPVLEITDYVQEGGVYTNTGAYVGAVDPTTDSILDSNDDVIGYVESGD